MGENDFETRPDMSIKVKRQLRDMRISGRIAGVRKHGAIRWHHSYYNLQRQGRKVFHPHELAHMGGNDFETRPDMSIKVKR